MTARLHDTLLRPVAVALIGIVLVWRALTVNVVLYEDTGRPRVPQPAQPGMPGSPPPRDALVDFMRQNPANAGAYLTLARADEEAGDSQGASRAYWAAYEMAPVDRDVLATVSAFFLRRGETSKVLALLAMAVEQYPDMQHAVFPVMAQSLASGREAAEWNAIAARDPSWLGSYVLESCQGGMDPLVLVPLFLARAAKATQAEAACLVDHLRSSGRWDEAYQLWLNTLPRERLSVVGLVFNGSFEFLPSGVGFDWMPDRMRDRESGHTVDFPLTRAAEGRRALRIAFNGRRQAGSAISQYLVLAPGRYEVSGMARAENVHAGQGAQWAVRCVSADAVDKVLAQSGRFVGSSDWERFAFEVTVPSECRGQLLQLDAAGAEDGSSVFLAGTVWFDNMAARQYH